LIDTIYDALNCPIKIAEHASRYVNALQAIASLIEPLNTITVAHVEEIHADGTRTVTIQAFEFIGAIDIPKLSTDQPGSDPLEVLPSILNMVNNDKVAEVLANINKPLTFLRIRKIIELLSADDYPFDRNEKASVLASANNPTVSGLDESAHSSYFGKKKARVPKSVNTMTLPEAQDWIKRQVTVWLKSKI
jgi:hypothetical protein